MATALSLSGCYTFVSQPVSQITPGALVSAEISEAGRAALLPQIGSEIGRLRGQMLQQSDSTLQLRVTEVQFLSGLSSPWQGQDVTLRPQDMRSLQQRTYSKRRSVIAAMAIAGLAVLAIAAISFAGVFSGDSGPGKGTDPPPQT